MGGVKATAGALALACALTACGVWHEYLYFRPHPEVVIPPPPPPIDAPADMPAFDYAPMTPQALMAHIERLSSNQFEGRAPGTHGETLTVDYIERAFQTARLTPGVPVGANAASWEQVVPLTSATIINNPTLSVGDLADMRAYHYGEDFVAWTKSGQAHVSLSNSELVFVGYGIVDRDLGWDDYAGFDVTGKTVIILSNDPDSETGDDRGFAGRAMTYYGYWAYKLEEAAQHGAAAAFIIHEPSASAMTWDAARATFTGPQRDLRRADPGAGHALIEGWLNERVARDLFARAGRDFAQEKARAQRPDFTPSALGVGASLVLDTLVENSISRNVVGVLPGRDRDQEAVLYTAHWDHLGPCPAVDGDDICNGAINNATGVAGLIELARRFASEPQRARSIAFIAFTGKEAGLLGSTYYAAHPSFAIARTAAAINIEGLTTLGPARDLMVVGGIQNDLDDMLQDAATTQDRILTAEYNPQRGAFYSSDQIIFARLGVPVLITAPGLDLYGGGQTRGRALMDVYLTQRDHKPSDQFNSNWDLTGAFRDLQLLHAVGAEVADSNDWPTWRMGSAYRALRDASRRQQR